MKLVKHAKFREENFGGVLFETRSEKVFALNPTAAAVVRELSAGCGEGELLSRVKARFSDPNDQLEREAGAFLANLRSLGLVEE